MIRPIEIKDYAVYAPGQFVIIEQYFVSTRSLAGKSMWIGVQFDSYENCDEEQPTGMTPFIFPFGAGVVEIPISNYSLIVEALDDRRFRVEYQFFNTGSSSTNGCAMEDAPGMLGIAVGYTDILPLTDLQRDTEPCARNNACWHGACANIELLPGSFQDSPIIKYFDADGASLNGYNLDGQTTLRFELDGQIGNTFYISFCSSYAQINQGVHQVGDLPVGAVIGGHGFIRRGSKMFATAIMDNIPSTTGYIVYSDGCTWKAARFALQPNTLTGSQPEIYPPTYGDVTCELTVNDEVINDCCVGVHPGQNVGVRLTMNKDQYNSRIIANDTFGNYDSNFSSVGMCISENPILPDQNCDSQVDHNNGVVETSINIQNNWEGKAIYVNFQWRFSIRTPEGLYQDVINKTILLNVGAKTGIQLIGWEVDNEPLSGRLCLDEIDNITAIVQGEEGQEFSIDSDLDISPAEGIFGNDPVRLEISTDGVQPFSNRCFTINAEGEVEDSDENPVDCNTGCTGVEVDAVVTDSGESGWKVFVSAVMNGVNITRMSINNEFFSGSSGSVDIEGEGEPAIIVAPLNIWAVTSDGCAYFINGYIEIENRIGATNEGTGNCQTVEIPFDAPECGGSLGIGVSCSDGSMTINAVGSIPGTISDTLQFSGGGTTSSQRFDLATRTIETTDCGRVVLYECFNCDPDIDWEQIEECEENEELGVEWSFDGVELTLTPTNDPNDPITDIIEYSLDNGATWQEYSAPVVVPISIEEIPIRRIATFENCDDAIYEEVIGKECDFTVTIEEVPEGLSIVVSDYIGSSVPTYRWEKETPSGITPFGNTEIIEPDENAIYRGFVTLDGCEKEAYFLVSQNCVDFDAFVSAVIPGAGGATLYAGVINPPAPVDFLWYQWSGSAYVQIGAGQSVQTSQIGAVKLIVKSGVCIREDISQVPVNYEDPWYYQRFTLTGGEDHVTITEFTLPDIANLHPDRIAYLMEVTENGVEQVYGHEVLPTDLHRLEYSIDGQKVNLNPAYTRAGSIIVVKMKKE